MREVRSTERLPVSALLLTLDVCSDTIGRIIPRGIAISLFGWRGNGRADRCG
jgi:hypothetical protein